MAKVLTQEAAKSMGLPGRKSLEIVSGEKGSQAVTLRLVEIPPIEPGDSPRGRLTGGVFSPAQVLPSGPVTLDDLRRVVIEIPR